jgi:hypothetical protein
MAIPTVYAGVQFRSRLEARWAAFFDLLRWPWDYEPIDLAGYIPDFVIRAREPFLVEVKGRTEEVAGARAKIERSGWEGDALIVTDQLHPHEPEGNHGLVLGDLGEWIASDEGQEPGFGWGSGLLMRGGCCTGYCSGGGPGLKAPNVSGAYGLSHDLYSFGDRLDVSCWKHGLLDPDDAQALRLWREAGNRVQWRSPRSTPQQPPGIPGIFFDAEGAARVDLSPAAVAAREEWRKNRGAR